MATTTMTQERDRGNGQYKHSLDRACTCGHTLGTHTAERYKGKQPCLNAEVGDGADCACETFKPDKAVR